MATDKQIIDIINFDISMLEKDPTEEEKWVVIGMKRAINHINMLNEMEAPTHKETER